MNCAHESSQVQAWLDGELPEAAALENCPACQERRQVLAALRGRLSPPPSPLGPDFARRTAHRIVHQAELERRIGAARASARGSWWRRLLDNPAAVLLGRERQRRLPRWSEMAALVALYSVSAAAFSHSILEVRQAYWGVMHFGLLLLVPLFLLGIEVASAASLQRGRGLEELLQTGVAPRLLSDTLAVNGLKQMVPAFLLVLAALAPFQPLAELAGWLPRAGLVFLSWSYLAQARLFRSAPLLALTLGGGLSLTAILSHGLWPWLALMGLVPLTLWARSQAVAGLESLQGARSRRAAPAWVRRLANYLPDLAVLQREVRRHPAALFSPSNWLLAGVASLSVYQLGGVYPLLGLSGTAVTLLAAWTASSLLLAEKDSGSHDVLIHSGLKPSDWAQSCMWLSAIQALPWALGGLLGCLSSGLAPGVSLLGLMPVFNGAGTWLGLEVGLRAASRRQAVSLAGIQLLTWLGWSALLAAFSQLIFGQLSPLKADLPGSGYSREFDLLGLIGSLVLGLYATAALIRRRWQSRKTLGLDVRLLALLPILPLSWGFQLAYEKQAELICWYGLLAGVTGLIWCWAVSPLMPKRIRSWPERLQALAIGSTYLPWVGLASFGISWLLALYVHPLYLRTVTPGGLLDWGQQSLVILIWGGVLMALSERSGWSGVAWEGKPSARLLPAGLLVAGAGALLGWQALRWVGSPQPLSPAAEKLLAGRQQRNRLVADFYYPRQRRLGAELKIDELPYELVALRGNLLTGGELPEIYAKLDRHPELMAAAGSPALDRELSRSPVFVTPLDVRWNYRSELTQDLLVLRFFAALRCGASETQLTTLEQFAQRECREWSVLGMAVRSLRSGRLDSVALDRIERIVSAYLRDSACLQQLRNGQALRIYDWTQSPRLTENAVSPWFQAYTSWLGARYLNRFAQAPGETGAELAMRELSQELPKLNGWGGGWGHQHRAQVAFRLALELERERLRRGAYPRVWTTAAQGCRLVYQPEATGYSLEVVDKEGRTLKLPAPR